MQSEYEQMADGVRGGWASAWLAIAVVAAIGVIWILPATALRPNVGLALAATIVAMIVAELSPPRERSRCTPARAL